LIRERYRLRREYMMEEQGKREREVSVGDAIIFIYITGLVRECKKNRRTNDVNNKIVLEARK
jgi:hypothetical protein